MRFEGAKVLAGVGGDTRDVKEETFAPVHTPEVSQ